MREAGDLCELYARYDDHVARAPELFPSSEHRSHGLLLGVVAMVAARVRPGFQPLTHALFEVRGTGFWHGMVCGTNALACFFYDARVGVGVVAINDPFDAGSRCDFVRMWYVMGHPPSVEAESAEPVVGSERLPN